ncbi:NADH-quinone oxidoreductase subunit J [Actinopolymorpha cephalotaxi]|uniref:NADH-quinone oxidoreductase subunit J n=1 Tax=Actinopolymorpha cephalotaxi TaxID=504797 RepID=A0A1I2NNN4_9ACTN|nr:NADH-quinone oxidoreductase subunit J [Actinopolymorpha cephalotaxi]NYH85467.1 NADH-quinone oxidoreductase subunit J [Actinopolymorpha cephalotaxi]SFG04359.1 NADH-quinone oxidoreductase subunit J [Actinopolymorpha cephalotaxi]
MTATFWVLAPIAVLAALGMVLVRKAVHSALLLAAVMMCLAIMYASLDAPFLFAVQVIVYTGAILMLFLFVLMLVGVDASDSVVETLRGQRWMAVGGSLLFGILILVALGQVTLGKPVGLAAATPDGNVPGLASLLFSKYVFAFEVTSALLITAAVGAMILAHREQLTEKVTQKQLAEQRFRLYADKGRHPGQHPAPGTFARHNAVDTPALLPDGTAAQSSVSRVLIARGTVRDPERYTNQVPGLEPYTGTPQPRATRGADGRPTDETAAENGTDYSGTAHNGNGTAGSHEGGSPEGGSSRGGTSHGGDA